MALVLSSLVAALLLVQGAAIPPDTGDPPYESVPDPQGRHMETLRIEKQLMQFMSKVLYPPRERGS